jgi:subtilisin family serine protease
MRFDRFPGPAACRHARRFSRAAAVLTLAAVLAGAAGSPAGAADLAQRARDEGSVRVLVGFELAGRSFAPDGSLAPVAAERQRTAIRSAQLEILEALAGTTSRTVAAYRFIPFVALEVDEAGLRILEALPAVRSIHPDVAVPPTMASSNPVIDAPEAWAAGFDGTGQVVAVLDTGVDKTHPFFTTGAKVVSEACYSSNNSASTSFCPGGASSSTAAGSGVNCPTSISACSHGTHVAGTAVGNDGVGPNFGVGRGAKVIAIQVFSRFTGANCGSGPSPCPLAWTSDQILGLERVYALRTSFAIAAANMSLGGGQYFDQATCDSANAAIKAAIDNLLSAGIATVISAGNNGFTDSTGAPGCVSTAVTVGATTDADAVASFSNIASFVDLVAPGVSIDSSVPGGGIATFQGTSMSAPHVTGAWAVLRQKKPAATVAEVLAALRNTAVLVDDLRPGGSVQGLRRIDVNDAVALLGSPPPQCYLLTRTHTGTGADPAVTPASSPACPAGQFVAGAAVQVSAAPGAGWTVGSWSGTGDDASRSAINLLAMPAGARTVSVRYVAAGAANLLLVDDDDNGPDVRASYTAALAALGRPHQVWNTANSDAEPTSADLAAHKTVVWFSGDEFGGVARPGAGGEAALGTFLNGGGCLILSSQDYFFDRGLTPFLSSYLGAASVLNDESQTSVAGRGSAFGRLGASGLAYPFSNFSDVLAPGAGAEVAFQGDQGVAALSKVAGDYRTVYLGFPLEALPTAAARTQALGAALDFCAALFADVPPGHWARRWAETLYHAGVTAGCASSPRRFCPDSTVTREQMAVFLLRAKEGPAYTPPACTTAPFTDVPAASATCPWIRELANRGVTSGCGGGKFCPQSPVTREQMALFLLKTDEGSAYVPPACTTPPFADVPVASPFCRYIKELAARGVTGGCGGGNFCPTGRNTRAQMAVFLSSTFGLQLP